MLTFEKLDSVSLTYQKSEDAPQKDYVGVVETVVPQKMIVVALLGDDQLPTGQYRSFKLEKIVKVEKTGKVSAHYLDGIK